MQEMSIGLFQGMLLLRNEKHFCYAGNVIWVVSENAFITEGLVLGGNTFIMQEMSLGLYLGMLL